MKVWTFPLPHENHFVKSAKLNTYKSFDMLTKNSIQHSITSNVNAPESHVISAIAKDASKCLLQDKNEILWFFEREKVELVSRTIMSNRLIDAAKDVCVRCNFLSEMHNAKLVYNRVSQSVSRSFIATMFIFRHSISMRPRAHSSYVCTLHSRQCSIRMLFFLIRKCNNREFVYSTTGRLRDCYHM